MQTVNVAARLTQMAQDRPDALAIVEPAGRDGQGKRQYRRITFAQLDRRSDRVAAGLTKMGVTPGTRLALLVPQGIDMILLVFGLMKAGAVVILIDPGMGRKNLIQCLADAQPDGFVAISKAQAIRSVLRRRFPRARLNVTVGRRWFWGGTTLRKLLKKPWPGSQMAPTAADDPAAIIFTTGSTGPPKGVLYRHGNFTGQVDQIQERFGIEPGEIDLPCFPMFGLFNCAMGVTAVIPDMDPTRPAEVDPVKIIEAVNDWRITQTFGSPAVWNRVSQYCREKGLRLETVRRVLSAGAPVPADVVQRVKACIHPDGDIFTPYGATEALPVAEISGGEVIEDTAEWTSQGAGVCVGRKFSGIEWKVVRIVDGPIATIGEAEKLSQGRIGELIVRGAVVTREYITRTEWNALAKIADGDDVWHRMGDTGYLDPQERFWFCGRVAHRVLTARGPMYTVPCEAIFNQHADVYRSALVGVGPVGEQRPVIVLEPMPGRMPRTAAEKEKFLAEVRQLGQGNKRTARIDDFLFHPAFPVDIRHNSKIFREKLAVWAAER
ncbi:MAG: AMP-binding protein [Planctomycetes bacterium]|nr:AMP-binding protein [Planctomycetota bacterium]